MNINFTKYFVFETWDLWNVNSTTSIITNLVNQSVRSSGVSSSMTSPSHSLRTGVVKLWFAGLLTGLLCIAICNCITGIPYTQKPLQILPPLLFINILMVCLLIFNIQLNNSFNDIIDNIRLLHYTKGNVCVAGLTVVKSRPSPTTAECHQWV